MMLLVAVATLVYSLYQDRKQRQLQFFSEYTRRYQDILLNMPDEVFEGRAKAEGRVLKYMRLYFDLCSEEYHLWKQGNVPDDVWKLWKEGMQITVKQTVYSHSWKFLAVHYSQEFCSFFNHEIINYQIEQ